MLNTSSVVVTQSMYLRLTTNCTVKVKYDISAYIKDKGKKPFENDSIVAR